MSKEFIKALWEFLSNYPKDTIILFICAGLLLLAAYFLGKGICCFQIDKHYNVTEKYFK